MECEKLAQEKTEIQRQYIMVGSYLKTTTTPTTTTAIKIVAILTTHAIIKLKILRLKSILDICSKIFPFKYKLRYVWLTQLSKACYISNSYL